MTLLAIKNLHLEIKQRGRRTSVLQGVDLTVEAGELVGLVGETGSGKTLTAMSILRLLPAGGEITAGQIDFAGVDLVSASEQTVRQMRGRQIGVILQQPRAALNPTRPVLQQMADRFVDLLGVSRRAAVEQSVTLLTKVGLPDPAVRGHQYPHQLSGGMCQRVMIGLAIAGGPQLLLADEPTTGLDVTLQNQILELLTELAQQNRMAVLLITHDLSVVAENCQRIAVMYAGEVVESGPTAAVLAAPRHPYTQGLVAAVSTLQAGQRPSAIAGTVPHFHAPPTFCPFATRCPQAFDHCREARPTPQTVEPGWQVACHLVNR